MKTSKTFIALTVAALIPLGAAVAGDKDKAGKMPTFTSLDANGDGRISQTEAAVDSKIVFSTADANGDGYLDKAEFKASQKSGAGPAPQTEPVSPTDPSMPRATESATSPQPDTETPQR